MRSPEKFQRIMRSPDKFHRILRNNNHQEDPRLTRVLRTNQNIFNRILRANPVPEVRVIRSPEVGIKYPNKKDKVGNFSRIDGLIIMSMNI